MHGGGRRGQGEHAHSSALPPDAAYPDRGPAEASAPRASGRLYAIHSRLRSIFQLHNETINVWTHVVGALLFLALLAECAAAADVPVPTRAAVCVFLLAFVVCFCTSSVYHLLRDVSPSTEITWAKLDYIGILAAMAGTDMPMLYFGMACWPGARVAYACTSCVLLVATSAVLTCDSLQHRSCRLLRLGVFVALCVYGWAHMGHEIVLKGGLRSARGWTTFVCWTQVYATYAAGIVFYVSYFPECCFPRRFDLVGSSHQLWHVFVVLAACVTYKSIWIMQEDAASVCAAGI